MVRRQRFSIAIGHGVPGQDRQRQPFIGLLDIPRRPLPFGGDPREACTWAARMVLHRRLHNTSEKPRRYWWGIHPPLPINLGQIKLRVA